MSACYVYEVEGGTTNYKNIYLVDVTFSVVGQLRELTSRDNCLWNYNISFIPSYNHLSYKNHNTSTLKICK